MKLYSRRIAFLISDQHLIPHGGIGQFCKGFTEMCQQLNWKVDILVDKVPRDSEFVKLLENNNANIIFPDNSISYTDHTSTFAFTDSINWEKVINFRNVFMKASAGNLYDLIVCNTSESMSAIYGLSLEKYIPVVFYSHQYSMVFRNEVDFDDACLPQYHEFYNMHTTLPGVYTGTQTEKNVKSLEFYSCSNPKLLRMPIPEKSLLKPYNGERKGVLFIGRWEDRKNPKAYIRVMKETGLPCKVMTNSSGKTKFETAFAEAGINDYEIRAGIIGAEKSEFIRSSSVFFMPALGESYGFAFMECLPHMPCVVLDNQNWSDNFDQKYVHKVELKNAANVITYLYNKYWYYNNGALEYIKNFDNDAASDWSKLLEEFEPKRSNNNSAKINNVESTRYKQFIENLNRDKLCREDIESVYSNRHKFVNIIYTDKDTYLSKDPNYVPVVECQENVFESLFEF